MKVLMVAGLFYPATLGGPANTLYWTAKALVQKGVDVTVVTSYWFIKDNKIKVNKWNDISGIKVRYCSWHGKIAFRIIWNAIKSLKHVDAVILSSVCFIPNTIVARIALWKKKKVIWSPRGEMFDSAVGNNKLKSLFFRHLKNHFARKVVFHATSSEEEMCIRNRLGSVANIILIPNYMELPPVIDGSTNEHYLLYVGRIAPIKALDNVIEALGGSQVFLESDYKMKIAGSDQNGFKAQLEAMINTLPQLKDKVEFLGVVQGDAKMRLYHNARFSVLVSHSENFGNVVLESLSQGTPVLVSHGTPWQIVESKKAGFWIDNKPSEISKYINTILSQDETEYQQYRSSAKDLAASFDVSKHIEEWMHVLFN